MKSRFVNYHVLVVLIVLAASLSCFRSGTSKEAIDREDRRRESTNAGVSVPNAISLEMAPVKDGPKAYDVFVDGVSDEWVSAKARRFDKEDPTLYRRRDDFYMLDKVKRQWFRIGLSKHASTIYPIETDPVDTHLIWMGCNDGSKGLHADYFAFSPPSADGENALLQGIKPGGLAVVDTKRKTVSYIGVPHLINTRVYAIIFDRFDPNSVWIWGKYPLGGEEDGIVRYDREKRQFIRYVYGKTRGRERWRMDTAIRVEKDTVVVSTGDQVLRINKASGRWEKEQ